MLKIRSELEVSQALPNVENELGREEDHVEGHQSGSELQDRARQPGALPWDSPALCFINLIFRVITSLTNCLKTHLVYMMLQWGK